MNSNLPATGTAELLELLAPYIPDDFIDQSWAAGSTGGRHREYTAAELPVTSKPASRDRIKTC
jgi:hypothetical protein